MKYRLFTLLFSFLLIVIPQAGGADSLPLLDQGNIIDVNSYYVFSDLIEFNGGSSFDNLITPAREINVETGDIVNLEASIGITKGLVGASAQVYVTLRLGGSEFFLYQDPFAHELQISSWGGSANTLLPFMTVEQLPEILDVPIYSGILPSGNLSVYLSLRIDDRYYASSSVPISVRVNRGTPSQPDAEFIAKENFLPNPDGFGFRNYVDTLESDLEDEDMVDFLGRDQACYDSPDGTCNLTAFAQQYKESLISISTGGHCYGMAVATTLLKQGIPFKGKKLPVDFQTWAESAMDLQKSSVRNFISYYFSTQSIGILDFYTDPANTKAPSEVLNTIMNQMGSDDPIAVVGVMDDEKGHAITPYGVEDMGNGEFHIYVYDNNWPDDAARYINVDTIKEAWSYEWGPGDYFKGDISHKEYLVAIPLSAHINMAPLDISKEIAEFQFSGPELEMMITNTDMQRIGYDFATGKYVNEIAGADIKPVFDVTAPPTYRVPVTDPEIVDKELNYRTNTFEIIMGALEGIGGESDTSFFMRSSNAMIEFDNIKLKSGEKFYAAVHPSGRLAYLNSESLSTQKPTITLTSDDIKTGQGYVYELSDLELTKGTTIAVLIEDDQSLNVWDVTDSVNSIIDSSHYSLRVTKIDGDGMQSAFATELELPVGSKTRIHVNKWDNNTTANTRTKKMSSHGEIEVEILK